MTFEDSSSTGLQSVTGPKQLLPGFLFLHGNSVRQKPASVQALNRLFKPLMKAIGHGNL
jgi:hypothetical protein